MKREQKSGIWFETAQTPLHVYELKTEYCAEGLSLTGTGNFEDSGGASAGNFSIDATMSWETLELKGLDHRTRYFPKSRSLSTSDSADRPRDPRKLSDLLIASSLTWPYVKGYLSFTPEAPRHLRRASSASKFFSMIFSELEMDLGEQQSLMVFDDGFAASRWSSDIYLTIASLGRAKLEKELRQRDTFAVQMTGEGIGSLRYGTGYGYEPSDRFNWIVQQFGTLSLRLALGKDGLEISADGELCDFDPIDFAAHRKERNSQLKPLRTYALKTTVPWALLVARGFSFAYRIRDFY